MNADEHLNAVISFPHGGLMIEVPGSRMDDIPGFVWVIAYALNRPYLFSKHSDGDGTVYNFGER